MKKKTFMRIWERGNELLGLASGFIALGVTFVIVYEVVLRFFFNRPTIWVTESSELLLVIITFLALSYTLQVDGHVAVTVLKERLSKRRQLCMELSTSVFALVFGGVLTWFSAVAALEDLQTGAIHSLPLPIPLFPIKIFIPIGGLLLCIGLLLRMRSTIIALASLSARDITR